MADEDDSLQPPDGEPDDEAGSGARGSADAFWLSSEMLAGITKQHQLFADLQSSTTRNLTAGLAPLNVTSILPQIKIIDLLHN
jgi:hypothetical protein